VSHREALHRGSHVVVAVLAAAAAAAAAVAIVVVVRCDAGVPKVRGGVSLVGSCNRCVMHCVRRDP
jgi:hypothetical protein